MARKLVNFHGSQLTALTLLAQDEGKSFQELIDEAVGDLLRKHKRPTTTSEMFKQSLRGKPGRRAKA